MDGDSQRTGTIKIKPPELVELTETYAIFKFNKDMVRFLRWLDDAQINKKHGIEYNIVFNSFADQEDATIRFERHINVDAFDLMVTFFNGLISLQDSGKKTRRKEE